MATVAFLSAMSTFFVLETMSRAQLLKDNRIEYQTESSELVTSKGSRKADAEELDGDEFFGSQISEAEELEREPQSSQKCGAEGPESEDFGLKEYSSSHPRLETKMELTDLCNLFLGRHGRDAYSISVAIYFYGTLTAYCSVFAESLAAHIPVFESSQSNYNLYLSIFFVSVVPMSCLELNEQIEWQVVLALCRLLMALGMVGSVMASNVDTDADADGALSGFMFTSYPDAPYGAPGFNFSGMLALLPLAAFANIFQHSIPALSHPVQDKTQLSRIFLGAIFFCFIAYSSIGSFLAYFFGSKITSASNLAWVSFVGSSQFSAIANSVSYYIVLFPGLDVASAFPLNAITLGNSLLATFKDNDHLKALKLESTELKIVFRMLAAIPPFMFAMLISDLGQITSYTGVFGFTITMVFPSALAYASKRHLANKRISTFTNFSNWLTSDIFVIVLFSIGILFTMLVLCTLL